MDPQHRLLLNASREALEDAGLLQSDGTVIGSDRMGVYIGIASMDYGSKMIKPNSYTGTGAAMSIAANRISYTFNLRGPSLAVDTACSSALVAMNSAIRDIRSGAISSALVGGVNLLLSSSTYASFNAAGMLSPDGKVKFGDNEANGYARGEGCGMIVLKRLSHAKRDGDLIYALVRGSAVNQDGRSNGLTAPNPASQEDVLNAAYKDAGVSPRDVSYVEAHGTGTKLGDPIELTALGRVLVADCGRSIEECGELRVGSVKTNIGHLEPAAGIANVIKSALVLKHNWIPPSLNMSIPNEHIAFDDIGVRVVTEGETLVKGSETGRAIVSTSSFGFGGTNAHVVLQQYSQIDHCVGNNIKSLDVGPCIIPFSSVSFENIYATADRFEKSIIENKEIWRVADIAKSAAEYRVHDARYVHRVAVVASNISELEERLNIVACGDGNSGSDGIIVGKAIKSLQKLHLYLQVREHSIMVCAIIFFKVVKYFVRR